MIKAQVSCPGAGLTITNLKREIKIFQSPSKILEVKCSSKLYVQDSETDGKKQLHRVSQSFQR